MHLFRDELEKMLEASKLEGKVEVQDKVRHLEYVLLSLGSEESGISEIINDKTDKPLIKNNGSLVYQQLFNGKVQVMIAYPYIEGFGDPRPPKVIGIYRPEEIKVPLRNKIFDFDEKQMSVYNETGETETFRLISRENFSPESVTLPIDKIVAKMIKERL